MGAPAQSPDGILVAWQHGNGALTRHADIKGANDAVDACGCNNAITVLVPVVR